MKLRILALLALIMGPAVGTFVLLSWLQSRDQRDVAYTPSYPDASRSGILAVLDRAGGRLLRPGPLARAHARLDGIAACMSCHGAGSYVQDARCLACHDEIALRAERDLLLHGTFKDSCASCHGDHRGLDVSLIDLDPAAFQHDRTRFPLRGGHVEPECETCHLLMADDAESASFRYQGVPFASCAQCHTDPHRTGKATREVRSEIRRVDLDHSMLEPDTQGTDRPIFSRDCTRCHTPERWGYGFDHDRDTSLELDDLHAWLACTDCHEDLRFRSAGRECHDCHTDAARLLAGNFDTESGEPDAHFGAVGCQDCHGSTIPDNRMPALAARCAECHPPSYASLLSTWRTELEAATRRSTRSAEATERLRRSGLHNFLLARELLGRWSAVDQRRPEARSMTIGSTHDISQQHHASR